MSSSIVVIVIAIVFVCLIIFASSQRDSSCMAYTSLATSRADAPARTPVRRPVPPPPVRRLVPPPRRPPPPPQRRPPPPSPPRRPALPAPALNAQETTPVVFRDVQPLPESLTTLGLIPLKSTSTGDLKLIMIPSGKVYTINTATAQIRNWPVGFKVLPDLAIPSTDKLPLLPENYKDRGCWGDFGYQYRASDDYAKQNPIGTVQMNLREIPEVAAMLRASNTDGVIAYARQKAIEGNYDTFALKNGNTLLLGNYGSKADGVVYKYDKFVNSAAPCPLGDSNFMKVFSTVEPFTTSIRGSDFVDRGCWYDNPESNKAIAKVFINMTKVGINRELWYNYALEKAVEGGYDTFAFQNNMFLFLGNYSQVYSYDKYVQVPDSITCNIFGSQNINRVFSTIAPSVKSPVLLPGNTSTANMTRDLHGWLK